MSEHIVINWIAKISSNRKPFYINDCKAIQRPFYAETLYEYEHLLFGFVNRTVVKWWVGLSGKQLSETREKQLGF